LPSSVSPKIAAFVTSTLSGALIAVKFFRESHPSVNLIFLTSGPLLIAARILAVPAAVIIINRCCDLLY
jgi:hypothetical protein